MMDVQNQINTSNATKDFGLGFHENCTSRMFLLSYISFCLPARLSCSDTAILDGQVQTFGKEN